MSARIALQLYTLRDALAVDLSGTLEQVAAAGYRGVETAFFGDAVPPGAPGSLRSLGLEVVAAHTNLPLGAAAAPALRAAERLGAPTLVWHGWPRDDRYDSRDGILRLAAEFNAAGETVRRAGRSLAIHNHWWECEPIRGDEETALDLLLRELDPAIGIEFDAYWAAVAGIDPAATAARLGNRLALLHLKDGPISRHEPMSSLGTGRMDLPSVVAAAGDHLAWAIVELDEVVGDPMAAVRDSRIALLEFGLDD